MAYFKDKVVWVTGASSGIGEALTYELSKRGARLVLSARRKEALEKVKGNCASSAQSNIKILPLDLAAADTLKLSVEAAIQSFGRIDVLINNGGISQRGLAIETSLEVDRRIMEVNYFGAIALTKYLLPHLIQQKSGRIAVISSLTGKFGTPFRSGYAAAKHALHGFFDSLRAELWKDNIKVTLIAPGFIQTTISVSALTGDGTQLNKMDDAQSNGMPVAKAARQIANAIASGKNEVYIGGKETLGVHIKRFFPGFFSRMIRKVKVR